MVWVCGARDYGQINTKTMIDKKLHDLKTKILRTKNIDDAMREELANDIFEIEKLVSSSNDIHNVRLSCYKEVFKKFQEIEYESEFYGWLYAQA